MSSKGPTGTCPTDFAVEVSHVSKSYVQWQRESKRSLRDLLKPEQKHIKALDDVSFTIKPGEMVAYAGPNGAGKSTTMKLCAGMLVPGEGDIRVLSHSPQKERIALMRKLGILFGNRTELWWDHPVVQSYEWKKVVWDIPESVYRENYAMVMECLELEGLMKTFARELSLGQRMRADLGMLLLHGPELVLLDEPTLGLDVVAKRRMISFLKRLNRERGVTVMVTSHDMDDLEEMADRVLMIASGRIVYDGAFDGLRALAGRFSRLRVTMGEEALPGQAHPLTEKLFTLLSGEGGVYEYEVDMSAVPVREVLQAVSQIPGVRDIEIKKAPIEQVIEELYRKWA